jgi:ankyrin repeat protein
MLLWAASTGRLRLVERLLKKGVPVDAELNGELPRESIEETERAFWWPGGTALHRLLANAERTHAPLFDESRIYSVAVLRLLTKSGASAGTVDALGRTPLHIAARGALDAAVETLLTAPGLALSRRDDSGQTALSEAVYRRVSKQIALKLVSLGLPDDPAERASLQYRAATSGDEEVLRALLDAGCDPNAGTPDHPGALLALANDANH